MSSSFFVFCCLAFFLLFLSHLPSQVAGGSDPDVIASSNSTKHRHRWIGPVGHRLITVSVNGSADFKSVQAAVDSVPDNNRKNVTIRISAGYYM